mmetsp:Transcript_26511/g.76598  ORF Transcript_26511/g.76598 Transcript_26511/m.76598 type:complete len:322 (+) Transcript_26511:68-1033(+)
MSPRISIQKDALLVVVRGHRDKSFLVRQCGPECAAVDGLARRRWGPPRLQQARQLTELPGGLRWRWPLHLPRLQLVGVFCGRRQGGRRQGAARRRRRGWKAATGRQRRRARWRRRRLRQGDLGHEELVGLPLRRLRERHRRLLCHQRHLRLRRLVHHVQGHLHLHVHRLEVWDVRRHENLLRRCRWGVLLHHGRRRPVAYGRRRGLRLAAADAHAADLRHVALANARRPQPADAQLHQGAGDDRGHRRRGAHEALGGPLRAHFAELHDVGRGVGHRRPLRQECEAVIIGESKFWKCRRQHHGAVDAAPKCGRRLALRLVLL